MTEHYKRQVRITDNFTQVPHGLWTADISWGAKCLLGWLHSHDRQYLASLSNQRIRRELGCSGIVSKWFDELVEAGFITVQKMGQRQQVTILASPWEALAGRKCHRSENGQDDGEPIQPVKKRSVTGQKMTTNRSKNDHIEYQGEHQLEHHTRADDNFDAFWTAYPRSEGKQSARKAWSRLSADDRASALEAIAQHVANWTITKTERRFIPHESSWLNGRRWEDELRHPIEDMSLTKRVVRFALDADKLATTKEHA